MQTRRCHPAGLALTGRDGKGEEGTATDASQAPAYPALGVAAKGIIRRSDGAVLLIRRSPDSGADPGCWDLPGGTMACGERLVDALVREVLEETGLSVTGLRPFHIAHFVKEPIWVTCVTFECDQFEGTVSLSDEHDELAWVSPDQLDGRPYGLSIREQLDAFVDGAGRAPGFLDRLPTTTDQRPDGER